MADDNDKGRQIIKVAITNNDVGPRFVNSQKGQEVVARGGVLETTMSGHQVDALDHDFVENTDDVPRWSVVTVSGPLQENSERGKGLADLSVSELRKIATAEEVQLSGRIDPDTKAALPDLKSGPDIAAAIQAKRDAK